MSEYDDAVERASAAKAKSTAALKRMGELNIELNRIAATGTPEEKEEARRKLEAAREEAIQLGNEANRAAAEVERLRTQDRVPWESKYIPLVASMDGGYQRAIFLVPKNAIDPDEVERVSEEIVGPEYMMYLDALDIPAAVCSDLDEVLETLGKIHGRDQGVSGCRRQRAPR